MIEVSGTQNDGPLRGSAGRTTGDGWARCHTPRAAESDSRLHATIKSMHDPIGS